MQTTSKFQSKILSRQTKDQDYDIYRAGLEWELTDPIVIESADDFKSKQRWKERLDPYHHQVSNLITFCRRLPVTLLADDVGLGKTISAGLVISELIARSRLSKVLIVCPKVLCPQWKEELETKFNVPCVVATGRELLSANPGDTGAVITTYNSARLYLDRLPENRFQMLILDEAHKLRNLFGTEKAPQVAVTFHKALQARRFRFVLMLTATPIQNRLWDLYSLIDLLTVARGHENPFGTPGMFARRFIADDKEKARQLKESARDEFRSIVYGYMSRVRRGDAQLSFPERFVQMHRVQPTPMEMDLINAIAKPIQKMNRLAQISILQALSSSPDALAAQLINMARKGTVPQELSQIVSGIVERMSPSAKLVGLGVLIDQLKKNNPGDWRLVVFTTRRETQTTIQNFLESNGLTVGLINGDSGLRNQETIARFKREPPACRVIVSTEAGSEGVNLQIANVLVNYDLPWNPMIVEQRIGRVQRLGSKFEHVSIFNITLKGTFEEYIVGRLMEKLQMASHAIGDIESLLQGSDVSDRDDDSASTFEDRILDLVLAALAGKDVDEDVRLKEQSIENAKQELAREEANINSILGGMDGAGYVGPRAPTLPPLERTMDLQEFTLAALRMLGATVSQQRPGLFLAEEKGRQEFIVFEEGISQDRRVSLYAPQSPALQRLIKRISESGVHDVRDGDLDPGPASESVVRNWADGLGAQLAGARVTGVTRSFSGEALLRVRATTAHDSYERLVSCNCLESDHTADPADASGLSAPESLIEDVRTLGIDTDKLRAVGAQDAGIAEFSRFYLERGAVEVKAAGTDERKRKKLEGDFTPRLDMTLVGLKGALKRDVALRARYTFPAGGLYESEFVVRPSTRQILNAPQTAKCARTGQTAPIACLAECDSSKMQVLNHLLVPSEVSGRKALSDLTGICSLSGKRALLDELEQSQISGQLVAKKLLKTSAFSGKRAEPDYFGRCVFSQADLLKTELSVSEISGKAYRTDQEVRSNVSGKAGHRNEFTTCHETRQPIALVEAETCASTDKKVRPGILVSCDATGKRVLPSELGTCTASGKRALKDQLTTSSISQASVLRSEAVQSSSGHFCLPSEVEMCLWSGNRVHPLDIRACALTGLPVHIEFVTKAGPPRLKPLVEMLDGTRRTADEEGLWVHIGDRMAIALKGGKPRVEAALLSPSKKHLAICSESKTMLGLRVRQMGAIYDLSDQSIVGRIAEGKRNGTAWAASA
jgi:superfamily II DNA or RNA helicase